MNKQQSQEAIQGVPGICVQDDEIDLGEVFAKIAKGKRFIGYFTAVTVLAVVAAGVAWLFMNPPESTYYRVIKFNFPTVAQGTYPSGERFTRNDIVSSPVVSRVYAQNHLKEKGISLRDFGAALTATPYAPNIEFIKAKYKKLLSNRKLSQAEIQDLEKKYTDELSAAQLKFSRVNFTAFADLGLSKTEIDKVLTDVPKAWSDIAIKDLGVLDLNIPSGKFYNPNLINQYEYIQAVQYLKDSTEILGDGLKALKKDQVGAQVRDPETGYRASDLIAQLDNVNSFIIRPLVPLVAASGLARNIPDALSYAQNKIQQLEDQIETLSEQADVYRTALELYQRSGETAQIGAHQAQIGETGMVQYGSDFLSKVADLVEKQKDAEFRQALLDKQVKLRLKIAELKTQVKELERAVKRYKSLASHKSDALAEMQKNLVENKIRLARDELVRLVSIYQRLLSLRIQRLVDRSGALYEQVSAEVNIESGLPSQLKKILLIATGAGVLSMFLAVMIVLVRRNEDKGDTYAS